ncbi:MAG: lipoprotein-releasing system ATP-binding protein LolD [Thiotrichales bacterium]|nr:MAG: lipoprotein-releasing system ATP-binding protein LolD [Thiotrichales bacterium]
MNKQIILSCHDLSKEYQEANNSLAVLQNINLTIAAGQSIGIVGASGSGKSTLLHLLAGLDTPTSGDLIFQEKNINQLSPDQRTELRGMHMGFIYQQHHLLGDFSALENVMMPLLLQGAQKTRTIKDLATKALMQVGLGYKLRNRPAEMSGGEKQRVAVARAIVGMPKIIFADEPTGNLDAKNADTVFNLLLDLQKQMNIALVIVTHNQQLAERLQKVFVLEDGVFKK